MTLIDLLLSRSSALTVPELASICNISPQLLYKMTASEELPSYRFRGAIRFDPTAIAEWLSDRARRGIDVSNSNKSNRPNAKTVEKIAAEKRGSSDQKGA